MPGSIINLYNASTSSSIFLLSMLHRDLHIIVILIPHRTTYAIYRRHIRTILTIMPLTHVIGLAALGTDVIGIMGHDVLSNLIPQPNIHAPSRNKNVAIVLRKINSLVISTFSVMLLSSLLILAFGFVAIIPFAPHRSRRLTVRGL